MQIESYYPSLDASLSCKLHPLAVLDFDADQKNPQTEQKQFGDFKLEQLELIKTFHMASKSRVILLLRPEKDLGSGGIPVGIGKILVPVGFLAGLQKVFGFGHEFVKTELAFIKSVPPGIIRSHHGRAHSGPAAFVMPEFVKIHFQFLIEKSGIIQQALLVELIQHGFGWLEIDLVILFNRFVQFYIMVLDPGHAMALSADFLHLLPFGLLVGLSRKRLEFRGAYGQRGLNFPGKALSYIMGGHDFSSP